MSEVKATESEIADVVKQLEWISWQRVTIGGSENQHEIDKQMEVLDGMILSDASLDQNGKNARMQMCVKYPSFIEAVKSRLPMFSWADNYTISRLDKRTNKVYTSHYGRTRVSDVLTKEKTRWYPNGKKIVPKDLVLSDQCLLWWYIGDGYLNRKKDRPNYRRVILATNGFTEGDVDFLITHLQRRLGNDAIYKEDGMIAIGRQSLCKFVQIVGSQSPVSDYQYKFEFGPYFDPDYWSKSFESRPLKYINEYRKKNKVRELNYKSREEITHE